MDRDALAAIRQFLESYVLKAIGALGPGEEARLQQAVPRLGKALGRTGSWDEILAAEMQLPPDLPGSIRQIWDENRQIAASTGETLDPVEFARLFVEANFR